MNKINVGFSGQLVFEYNEDGSKTSDVCVRSKSGKLFPLGFTTKIFFKKGTVEIESVSVTHRSDYKCFKTHEQAVKYILSCLEKQGYEINEEVILNYDI